MALLDIKKAGAPVLKEICAPVDKIDAKLKRLMDDMAETMYEANGVGLAAPQVGIPIRLMVIDSGEGLFEFINPTIVKKEGSEIDTEGCLSVPDQRGKVARAQDIRVRYYTMEGVQVDAEFSGFAARIVQHEIDHLNGILFTERL